MDKYNNFLGWLAGDAKRLILLSIGLAFVMTLMSFFFNRAEQAYAFPSCAILWAGGLIAWAICGNKKE